MVDFAKEQVISPRRLAKRLDVSMDTIRRWFRQGLERRKICGKVYTSLEALNRFSPEPTARRKAASVAQSMDALKSMGLTIGTEPRTDGKQSEAAAV
jgi:DeoR/GlpR family transcriptional regulator of sugar metabolism